MNELVNTILLQYADNPQMTYSILGKSIVAKARDLKLDELNCLRKKLVIHEQSTSEIDESIEFYKNLKI